MKHTIENQGIATVLQMILTPAESETFYQLARLARKTGFREGDMLRCILKKIEQERETSKTGPHSKMAVSMVSLPHGLSDSDLRAVKALADELGFSSVGGFIKSQLMKAANSDEMIRDFDSLADQTGAELSLLIRSALRQFIARAKETGTITLEPELMEK